MGRGLGLAAVAVAVAVATTISPSAAVAAPAGPAAPTPLTWSDGIRAGTFTTLLSPAVITMRRSPAPVGRLDWNFLLTPTARWILGDYVDVGIDRAYVNGREITSPYGHKYEVNTYDWHASLNNYNWKGSAGGGTIKTGDQIALYWSLMGDDGFGSDHVVCKIPAPGVG